ncbi:phosphoribosyltransferase [Pacificibacter marinus]|uniref:Phosphoribosyltransferase n=1 Tax=Pacificibacter marinus TaxID=658057 RepID=A0A1Y5RGK6_9RHOB|nr:phosphoribosyltransferase [Pacificibacter marinus]SEK21641.1 Phosphoribosyl transferase domain-containing protein [Pacificibacter marinus]SLN16137.1 phosphoribosyltransferase [Pacificibacter marinus]
MRTDVWQSVHTNLNAGVQGDQETYAVPFGAGTLLLPIRQLSDGVRGVASLILNQASFAVLDALADELAEQLKPHAPDVIVAVPTLGLPLAEAVARRLGHARLVPLSNSRKFWYDDALSVDMSSITSPGQGKRLYLDPRMVPLLSGRVAVIDDVLSSGSSIASVLRLLCQQQIAPTVIGAAMLQGDAWTNHVGDVSVVGAFGTPILKKTDAGWAAP